MKISFDDYKTAVEILSQRNKLDRFGKAMVCADWINWAKGILSSWFTELNKQAKKMAGHLHCRLKLAWLRLKNGLHLKAGKPVVYMLDDGYNMAEFSQRRMKSRTAKSRKQIRSNYLRQANRIGNWDIFNLL